MKRPIAGSANARSNSGKAHQQVEKR